MRRPASDSRFSRSPLWHVNECAPLAAGAPWHRNRRTLDSICSGDTRAPHSRIAFLAGTRHQRFPDSATFLILKRVQDTPERSVLPASTSIAMAREPLNQPSLFGLTSTPQAFYVRR